MFEGDSADMCAGKFPLKSMGGQAEGLVCADPGARTGIGVSGNSPSSLSLGCQDPPSFSNLSWPPSDVCILKLVLHLKARSLGLAKQILYHIAGFIF